MIINTGNSRNFRFRRALHFSLMRTLVALSKQNLAREKG